MNEKFLSSEEIKRNLKKNKFRLAFSLLFFLFCFIFGFLFMLFSPSFLLESELISPLILYVSMHIMSKKDEIFIMYNWFANGIYFIELNTTGGQSLIYKKPKKLPQFFIRLNKKITLEGFTYRVAEFSGFFKIPLNEDEYTIGDAKVLFMPLATLSKSQGSTDKIQMMADHINGKTF